MLFELQVESRKIRRSSSFTTYKIAAQDAVSCSVKGQDCAALTYEGKPQQSTSMVTWQQLANLLPVRGVERTEGTGFSQPATDRQQNLQRTRARQFGRHHLFGDSRSFMDI